MAVDPTPVFWNRILDQLRQRLPSQQAFDTWFQPVAARRVGDGSLEVEVPSLFFADWIQQHYLEALGLSAEAVLGARPEVRFIIRPELALVARAGDDEPMRDGEPEPALVGAALAVGAATGAAAAVAGAGTAPGRGNGAAPRSRAGVTQPTLFDRA